jgi:hypothetical protein
MMSVVYGMLAIEMTQLLTAPKRRGDRDTAPRKHAG